MTLRDFIPVQPSTYVRSSGKLSSHLCIFLFSNFCPPQTVLPHAHTILLFNSLSSSSIWSQVLLIFSCILQAWTFRNICYESRERKDFFCHQNHNNYVSKIITAWCVIHLIPSDRESSLPADKSNCRLAEIWYKINHQAQALCPLEFYQIKANSTPKKKFIAMAVYLYSLLGHF